MKVFPDVLNVKHKDGFPSVYYNRVMCYLRKAIYEHMISHDENSYFDLEKFGRIYFTTDKREELITKMGIGIKKELTEMGWKCKLSFGETALFIYSSENHPKSCWDDGL